jgi:hypothetical protein
VKTLWHSERVDDFSRIDRIRLYVRNFLAPFGAEARIHSIDHAGGRVSHNQEPERRWAAPSNTVLRRNKWSASCALSVASGVNVNSDRLYHVIIGGPGLGYDQ